MKVTSEPMMNLLDLSWREEFILLLTCFVFIYVRLIRLNVSDANVNSLPSVVLMFHLKWSCDHRGCYHMVDDITDTGRYTLHIYLHPDVNSWGRFKTKIYDK